MTNCRDSRKRIEAITREVQEEVLEPAARFDGFVAGPPLTRYLPDDKETLLQMARQGSVSTPPMSRNLKFDAPIVLAKGKVIR
jgi:hypothetical protein